MWKSKWQSNGQVKCKSIRYEEYLCRYIITGSFFYMMKVIIMQSEVWVLIHITKLFTRLFAVIDKTCCFTFSLSLINHRQQCSQSFRLRKMSRLDSFLSIVCSYGIDPSQSTILDIGCGNGRFTLELSRVFQKVVTIDSSDTVIQKLLRKMEAENITNISGNNCLNECEGFNIHLYNFSIASECVRITKVWWQQI